VRHARDRHRTRTMCAYITTCVTRCSTSNEPRATKFTWERSTLGIGLSRMVQTDDTPEGNQRRRQAIRVRVSGAIGNGKCHGMAW
jgi:hypothetical protein